MREFLLANWGHRDSTAGRMLTLNAADLNLILGIPCGPPSHCQELFLNAELRVTPDHHQW